MPRFFASTSLCLLGVSLVLSVAAVTRAADESAPEFQGDIRPILTSRCGKCHNDKTRKGDLSLASFSSLKRGGESGESAIADTLEDSLLWSKIDGGDMPPEGESILTKTELALIKRWIESGASSNASADETLTQHDVLPYLYTRCVVCHGRRKQEGDLDLRTVESILKGGKSGPAVVPGKPDDSLLLKKVLAKDMPPPRELIRAGVRPLESSEIALITRWIAQGAKTFDIKPDAQTEAPDELVTDEDRKFWAFQTPQKQAVPAADSALTLKHPIDHFLHRRLRQLKLSFSAPAPKLTLIRRVAYDLTGLPPEWNDVQRFLNDGSNDWYEKLVDFYLASTHYGERWGRYWLDISGYADSEGKRSADPIRQHAWRYRDYVIRSLNDDKPYDRFLLEQLAGDELYDFENADAVSTEMMDSLVATGFLRMAPDGTGSDIVDTVEERFEVVADEIEVLGSSVLGLTLKCAQCHSHKYDPIPQRDYYRLMAVFQGAYDVYDWLKPTSVPGQSKQATPTRRYLKHVTDDERTKWLAAKKPIDEQISAARKMLAALESESRSKFVKAELAKLPEELRADVEAMLKVSAAKRTEIQKYLASKFEERLTVSNADLLKKFPELKKLKTETDKSVKKLQAELPTEPMIRALWDRGEPSPTWLFRRGEFTNPGNLMGPGVLSVLSDGRTPFLTKPRRNDSTGRRLAFAEWLTDRSHPLTARVLVNRVWFHHFGRGIVESLANFGKTGTPPTHPELLDWLAVSFMENNWSMKWLHRQIMTSTAYRQSSQLSEKSERLDSDNRWLSRMPLRRLEAESVRDSLLAVAGRLDRTRLGEPDTVTVRADGLVTSNGTDEGWRRTIYVRQRRKELPTILEAFDLPQMIPNCVERPNSTVASQALHLLNNGMVRGLSAEFAKRIAAEVPNERYRQIERVYEIALSRSPTVEEKELALATLDRLTTHWEEVEKSSSNENADKPPKTEKQLDPGTRALANFCHVIMNSAAFLFID